MRVTRLIGLACLAYILWRPVSTGIILYPVLALLALTSLVRCGKPPAWLLRVSVLIAIAVTLMLLVGSFYNTPGLLPQAILWVGAPIIWGLWANSFRVADIRATLFTVLIATIALSSMILLYVATQQGYAPRVLPDAILNSQGAGFNESEFGSAIRFYGLSTLTSAAPLAAAGIFAKPSRNLPPRILMIVAALLSCGAALFAGRQAILIVTVISPFLFLAAQRFLRPTEAGEVRRRHTLHPGWVMACPSILLGLAYASSSSITVPVKAAFQDAVWVYLGIGSASGANVTSDYARKSEIGQLMKAWFDRPFFGSGMGARLPSGYIRSEQRPWMFEMQYHQLLFDGGIIAVLLIVIAFIGTARAVVIAARGCRGCAPAVMITAVAALAMLIANSSNPYLQAPAHWWPIALALGVAVASTRSCAIEQADFRVLHQEVTPQVCYRPELTTMAEEGSDNS